MIRALAAFAVFCASLLVFGALAAPTDRMRLSAATEPRRLHITVTLPDVTERYHWLSVHGCSAEVQEFGAVCTGDFERETSFELSGGRAQHVIVWRDLPGGTMLVTAMAFDGNRERITSATRVVFRGVR